MTPEPIIIPSATAPVRRLSLSDASYPPIPELEDYDVHPIHGFLPVDPPPMRRLPDYFEPWEEIMDDLNSLLLAGSLRKRCNELPLLSTEVLRSKREWQRAYMILSFIGQAYVWGKNEGVAHALPVVIARPWHETAQYLGIKPVITYAAVELYNYYLLDPSGPFDLSNFAVMHTFTGLDEAWFYLISIATEEAGAPALPAIVNAMKAIVRRDLSSLAANLKIIAEAIDDITKIMVRMYEKNDPHIFYHRVRTYLAGWENSEELPDGLFYEGVLPAAQDSAKSPAEQLPDTNHGLRYAKGDYSLQSSVENLNTAFVDSPMQGTYRKYAGASAGQSSLIHCLDVALGIEHHPTRPRRPSTASANEDPSTPTTSSAPNASNTSAPTSSKHINHIHEMRKYMPGPHREFIYALARGPSIRDFVHTLVNTPNDDPAGADEVSRYYNRCVEGMRAFRDRHLQVVATYIVVQARKKREVGHSDLPNETKSRRVQQSLQARGTGGTDLIPFLKQSRDETSEARVELEL
ncbi:Indoleamine 2,3-dioxygenase [Gaertneriomyces semiglobifer]|nr:Indoleamine 2,3-dioxygenase [Gaertneriomyces semiglobifer]